MGTREPFVTGNSTSSVPSMRSIEQRSSRPGMDVSFCLQLPDLAQAYILSGEDLLGAVVDWVAVMEWPIENFVNAGDFILTTGIGCDEAQLATLVADVAASGAAAVCLAVGDGAPHLTVPESVIDRARESGVVLLGIPWRVRFSDVSRSIIEALYSRNRGGQARPGGDLPFEFTRALLETGGVASVAQALEGVVDAPAVVLDVASAIIGSSSIASDWVDRGQMQAILEELATAISTGDLDGTDAVRHFDCSDSTLVVAPAHGQGKVLGWVVVIAGGAASAEIADRAVQHAATAAAIELLRQEAAEEFGSRARGQFAWGLAAGEFDSPQELAARSALLGLPLNTQFTVSLGLAESEDEHNESSNSVAREVAQRLRMRLQHTGSIATHRESEILLCLDQGETALDALFDDPSLKPYTRRVSWGTASGLHKLSDLQDAAAQARTALAVTRAVRGPGRAATADQLGSFMLLHGLESEPVAMKLARDTIGPLEEADTKRSSDLLGTLAVYLDENGNISSAARRLHLNRHSLIYRLKRIEQLTQRNLDSHEDRLLLDISMRVRQLRGPNPD